MQKIINETLKLSLKGILPLLFIALFMIGCSKKEEGPAAKMSDTVMKKARARGTEVRRAKIGKDIIPMMRMYSMAAGCSISGYDPSISEDDWVTNFYIPDGCTAKLSVIPTAGAAQSYTTKVSVGTAPFVTFETPATDIFSYDCAGPNSYTVKVKMVGFAPTTSGLIDMPSDTSSYSISNLDFGDGGDVDIVVTITSPLSPPL